MRVDRDGEHAVGFVGLDEAYAAHVSGEVENQITTGRNLAARVAQAQVSLHVLGARVELVPLLERLDVPGTDVVKAKVEQAANEMTPDEPPQRR